MKASLEINEGKYHQSFEESVQGLESIEQLLSESIQKTPHFSFKGILSNAELTEFNFLKMKFHNLEIKDKILLKVINEIEQDLSDDEKKIVLFHQGEGVGEDEINKSSISIYNSINKVVHKTLHGKKNLEMNSCIFLKESDKNFEVSENYKNTENDKKICNLKEKNKSFEFIVIKSLMISITNYMTELISSYINYYEKIVENNKKKIEEEQERDNVDFSQENENEEELLKFSGFDEIYSEIYNDFVTKSNICSELEEYFKYSLESFKAKYQMNFTLSELFSDIFWNSIFHNKILCQIFIESYSSDDYGDIKIDLKKIMKVIFDTNIPLKHQIVELLNLHQIESNEKEDLMTLIVDMKNKYHCEIVKSEKEKENLKQIQRIKEKEKEKKAKEKEKNEGNNLINKNKSNNVDEININNINKINENKDNDNKINIIKNKQPEMKNEDNIKCNIITANDISVIKNKKKKTVSPILSDETRNNNIIIGVENNIDKNEIKEKENNININDDGVPDLTHKTVDEIINYINDDRIVDKSTKGKRKKKSRKNKKAKKEEALAEQNKNEIEDSLVLKFKEDLNNEFIHAGSITKIKPMISESWIKLISNCY